MSENAKPAAPTRKSSENARKHGLRAEKFFVTPEESEAEFETFVGEIGQGLYA